MVLYIENTSIILRTLDQDMSLATLNYEGKCCWNEKQSVLQS